MAKVLVIQHCPFLLCSNADLLDQCDTQRPCGRCLKKQIPCDVFENLKLPCSPQSIYGVRSVTVGHASSDLGIHELELIHHYQNWVCPTLPGQPPAHETWQSAIPKEATSHSGLMHGLLAVAALHRSHLDSSGHARYRAAAMKHQNLSLPYLRFLINNASADNCNALFALSAFVAVFVLALPQSPIAPTKFDPFKEMITLTELVKGVSTVTEVTRTWLLQGPLRPLLLPELWEIRVVISENVTTNLDYLVQYNQTLIQSNYKRAIYDTAIRRLRKTFEMLTLKPTVQGVGLFWVAVMQREYVDLLKAGEPMALVILAHFGVALFSSKESWWTGNWGFQLVKAVHDMLDEHWRCWIQWPLMNVGLCTDGFKAHPYAPQSLECQNHVHHPKIGLD